MSELYYAPRRAHPFYEHGAARPILPDVQFRVPMESMRDLEKVKDALDLEGIHEVRCDLGNQTVTVSGNVPYHRLLKKLKHVKRRSKLLSFASPEGNFLPAYGHELYENYPYGTSYGASTYGRVPMRASFSPPREYSSSYVAPVYERPYYEDYEDYVRPYRYGY